MGHAGGDLAQRLDTAQTLGQGEDLGVLAEVVRSSLATLDAEAEHTTAHAIAVLLESNLAVGVRVDTGVVDGDDVRGSLKSLSHGGGVLGSLASAEVQGLQTTVSQPAVEWRRDSANGILKERETLLQVLGVESGDTHQDIGVAVDVLGDGVDDDISAVVKRVLDVGAHEGVIDNDVDAMAVGDLSDGLDIDQAEGGVGGGLDPDKLGVAGANQFLDVQLDGGREGHLDAVGGGNLGEVSVGSAVDIGDRNDVRPAGKGLQDVRGCGRAGGIGKGVFGVLESGDGSLEVIPAKVLAGELGARAGDGPVRVGAASVLVQADGAADAGLSVGGG